MPAPLKLVASNPRVCAPSSNTAPPSLTPVPGPTIRIQSGMRITLALGKRVLAKNPDLTGDALKIEVMRLLDKLPENLRQQVAYSNNPVLDREQMFPGPGRVLVWLYVREPGMSGPWNSREQFEAFLCEQAHTYAELVAATGKAAVAARYLPRLMYEEDAPMPGWFTSWQQQNLHITSLLQTKALNKLLGI